ncbi:MAG: methionyl-tRNA formyltransferase [Cyanobacteria bacterium J06641_5]
MKVVFMGTPQFAVPTLEKLLAAADIAVLAALTQPDKPRGRGKKLIPSPVKQIAETAGIPVWQPRRIKKDAETLEKLQACNADFFVVVAYGQILSQEILDMPRLGCINVHGSLLPAYRGAGPIQWCLYNGEAETGITTMLMDAGMDTGAMLLKAAMSIDLLTNTRDLAEALSTIGADLLLETLQKRDRGEIEPIPQDNALATHAPLIKKPDFNLDWTRAAIALHNQIRGFHPNCVTTWREQTLKIMATVPLGQRYVAQLPADLAQIATDWDASTFPGAQPGEIVGIAKNFGPIVQAGEGLLWLQEVQLAGKRAQSGWDFANGTRLDVGEVLGNRQL